MNILENLSLTDINELYRLQDLHFQNEIKNIKVDEDPFYHFEHKNLFQNDFYNYMKSLMPEISEMSQFSEIKGVPSDYPKERRVFFISARDNCKLMCTQVSDPKLRYNYVRLYNWFNSTLAPAISALFNLDITTKTHDEFIYVNDDKGFSLKPHTDIPQKILTVLVYMPDDDSSSHCGTNVLVPKNFDVLKKPAKFVQDFNIVKTSKFIPNNTFSFRRSDHSFHSVSDSQTVTPRKFLLFTVIDANKK